MSEKRKESVGAATQQLPKKLDAIVKLYSTDFAGALEIVGHVGDGRVEQIAAKEGRHTDDVLNQMLLCLLFAEYEGRLGAGSSWDLLNSMFDRRLSGSWDADFETFALAFNHYHLLREQFTAYPLEEVA